MKKFENKVVWITGASSGIGEATAYQFAQEGAKLILSARREEELLRVKKREREQRWNIFDLVENRPHPISLGTPKKSVFNTTVWKYEEQIITFYEAKNNNQENAMSLKIKISRQ